ncbi:GtrA family protein [Paenibacillus sp. HJGM_3]|uniref:GtrA family protein n=1 Tax=Paenibacillus sp. HJGM_3 TaxID=3379816 RepID=UPI00385F3F0B
MAATLQRLWQHSFVRFLLVGVLNTLIGLSATYLLLNGLDLHYWIATFLGNCIGACVSYVLNRTFTFQSQTSVGRSAWRFVAVILVCYGLSYAAGLVLSDWLLALVSEQYAGWADNLAVLIGAGLYTITNYIGQRFFAFRESRPSVEPRKEEAS